MNKWIFLEMEVSQAFQTNFMVNVKNNQLVTNVDGWEIIFEHPVVQLNETYFLVTKHS